MVQAKKILVADDDEGVLDQYRDALENGRDGRGQVVLMKVATGLFGHDAPDHGSDSFDVSYVSQGEDAVDTVRFALEAGKGFSLVFVDIEMPPGMDGIETARRIREIDPDVNIAIVSSRPPANAAELPHEIAPADRLFFFQKPFHSIECRQLALAVAGRWLAMQELERSNEVLEDRIEKRTAALHRLAYFDPVTDLPNRTKLITDLNQMIDRAKKNSSGVAVILLDIERFGRINETMGYESGTRLLTEVGSRLKARCRQQDTAGRFGADEFACLIDGASNNREIEEIVDRLERSFLVPFSAGEVEEVFLRPAIGVACYPHHGGSADQIFRGAEAALKKSKAHAIRKPVIYNDGMGAAARRRMSLEAELRSAVSTSQITPHFQPQFRFADRQICGAEVLARWVKPDGESIPPNEFIPLVEELGLCTMLFESLLERSLGYVAGWQRMGWSFPISVNVSAHQLHDPTLPVFVREIRDQMRLPGNAVRLELTESVLVSDLSIARSMLECLAESGIGVHVDDFGTGYASLSYLAELPVDGLKIDRSFIAAATGTGREARLVQAIAAMGRAMLLEVTAEGVETMKQFEFLRDAGCDVLQGYLLGRPMSGDDFGRWLSEQRTRETA